MERLSNDNVRCKCGELCRHIISRTQKNKNRIFVICPKPSGGCGFWEWLDEIRICRCKRGLCKLLTSQREWSKNKRFYCCPLSTKEGSKGCGLWEWADPPQNEAGTSSKGKEVKEEVGSSEKPMEKKNVEKLRSWLTMHKEVTNDVVSGLLAKLEDLGIDD